MRHAYLGILLVAAGCMADAPDTTAPSDEVAAPRAQLQSHRETIPSALVLTDDECSNEKDCDLWCFDCWCYGSVNCYLDCIWVMGCVKAQ